MILRMTSTLRGMAPNIEDFWAGWDLWKGQAASYGQLGRKEEGAQAAADVLRTWPFFRVDKFITNFQDETDRALIAEGLRKAGLE